MCFSLFLPSVRSKGAGQTPAPPSPDQDGAFNVDPGNVFEVLDPLSGRSCSIRQGSAGGSKFRLDLAAAGDGDDGDDGGSGRGAAAASAGGVAAVAAVAAAPVATAQARMHECGDDDNSCKERTTTATDTAELPADVRYGRTKDEHKDDSGSFEPYSTTATAMRGAGDGGGGVSGTGYIGAPEDEAECAVSPSHSTDGDNGYDRDCNGRSRERQTKCETSTEQRVAPRGNFVAVPKHDIGIAAVESSDIDPKEDRQGHSHLQTTVDDTAAAKSRRNGGKPNSSRVSSANDGGAEDVDKGHSRSFSSRAGCAGINDSTTIPATNRCTNRSAAVTGSTSVIASAAFPAVIAPGGSSDRINMATTDHLQQQPSWRLPSPSVSAAAERLRQGLMENGTDGTIAAASSQNARSEMGYVAARGNSRVGVDSTGRAAIVRFTSPGTATLPIAAATAADTAARDVAAPASSGGDLSDVGFGVGEVKGSRYSVAAVEESKEVCGVTAGHSMAPIADSGTGVGLGLIDGARVGASAASLSLARADARAVGQAGGCSLGSARPLFGYSVERRRRTTSTATPALSRSISRTSRRTILWTGNVEQPDGADLTAMASPHEADGTVDDVASQGGNHRNKIRRRSNDQGDVDHGAMSSTDTTTRPAEDGRPRAGCFDLVGAGTSISVRAVLFQWWRQPWRSWLRRLEAWAPHAVLATFAMRQVSARLRILVRKTVVYNR